MNDERREEDFADQSGGSQESNQEGAKTGRSFIEVLLDPRTLQGLMLCGAGLLVLGLVVWLWSIGIFDSPQVVAVCMGAGNLALIAAGVAAVRYSRYQTAGKAITLLGCLVLPLNLWFYDAQGLITLDQGGHLWVPALACCAIYVVVARVLADPKFVYAIVGGIAMTGMLFLADRQVGHFQEIISPSALLVVLGMICIHVERAFASGDGPFSREKFGRAFFHSGHVVMALGLIVLLAGRLAGWLYDPYFAELGWFAMPDVATQTSLKLIAIVLALGATYSYIYSQLVVEARGRYVVSAMLTLVWCAVMLLDLLAIKFTMPLVALLLAGMALAVNVTSTTGGRNGSNASLSRLAPWVEPLTRSGAAIASWLHFIVACLGIVLYGRARLDVFHELAPYEFSWMFVAAMLTASVSCWWSARDAGRSAAFGLLNRNIEALVLFSLFTVAGTLACLGMQFSVATLVVEMLVPLSFAGFALKNRSMLLQLAWARAAELAAILLLVTGAGAVIGLVEVTAVEYSHLWLMLFFGLAAICFGVASACSAQSRPAVLSALALCGAMWQFLKIVGVSRYELIFAATLVGVVCVVAARIMRAGRDDSSRLVELCQKIGWSGVTFGGAGAMLLSLARVLVSETESSLLYLLIAQIVAAVVTGFLTKQSAWRRHFFVLAAGEVIIMLLVVNSLSMLTFLQRVEVFATVGGLLMLGAGYLGWYRESDSKDELVSLNLGLGSMLSAIPLLIGLIAQRFGESPTDWGWTMLHELGVLVIGLGLLGSGLVCRIRWSTLVGAATLAVYVVSLVGLIRLPDQLQSTAVYMMVGGGLFFGVAVLLSVYRDRLLALPKQVREGEGVFRVLKWR